MRLLVIGAGGHAKVVIETAQAAGFQIAGVVGREGDATEVLGHPVSHDAASVSADAFVVAIGDNAARATHYTRCLEAGLTPAIVIHPTAVISPSATIGPGTFVSALAVVNAQTRVGANVILNTACVVEHDVVVGDHALIGPNASLCGGVRIGEGVLFGAGATAIPTVRVSEWSVVAAGATVASFIARRTLCAGTPARAVRSLGDGS